MKECKNAAFKQSIGIQNLISLQYPLKNGKKKIYKMLPKQKEKLRNKKNSKLRRGKKRIAY